VFLPPQAESKMATAITNEMFFIRLISAKNENYSATPNG
jgi:hypothetical protein